MLHLQIYSQTLDLNLQGINWLKKTKWKQDFDLKNII